jgi:glucose/mannose transport system substrate-binding protein
MASSAFAAEKIEVLHWWTSGGEAKALNVLKQMLEKQGITWEDMPVAGGGGEQAMTVLRARVTAGNPPTAVQLLGFDITDWAKQGQLTSLDEVANKEGWGKVIPAALQNFSKYDGHWIAAPVNVHSTNWVWANKAVFDKLGLKQPETWDDLIAALDKMKAAGITPIAQGGQPWQEATLWEAVLLSTGGPDFYKKAMIDLDKDALGSDTMKTVFDRVAKLRTYVDDNFSGRDWNLATAMVIEGKAGVQFMGDWAKGEFLGAGKKPGDDFMCFRFPGTQGTVTFNADQFVMFKGKGSTAPQMTLASDIESPEFQVAFNTVKGSVPARTDVSGEKFDACGQKGIKDLAEAAASNHLLGSMAHGYAQPASIKNAMYDVITAHFNGEYDSATAVKELVSAVEDAK